jgi:radical SAM superfamily enzyme YgiQ (UPF0313 family)
MKTQKVLLVNPPFYRVLGSHYNGISLGISYIASALNQIGHDAWVYNADFLKINDYKTLYKVYKDFPEYIEIFQNDEHPIWTETIKSIIEFNPDWVGYTSYTANLSAIKIISNGVAKGFPAVKQFVGGVQSTLDPEILTKLPSIDFSIRREGEKVTCDLVSGLDARKIKGVTCRNSDCLGGLSEIIDPLEKMPFPERDKFWTHGGRPASPEEKMHMDVSYIATLRGCPYRCTFCASPSIWGRKNLQYRSPENIVDEVEIIKNKYWKDKHIDYACMSSNSKSKEDLLKEAIKIQDNTIVYFVDDVFTLKKKRTIEILQNMIDRNLAVPWKCESRADNIDDEIAHMMSKSNCVRVKLGIESGSDKILKQIKKDEKKEDMRKGIAFLKKYKIPITCYLMTGFPGETDDDLQQTIDFANEIEADYYSLSILSPYFGTEIFSSSVASGISLEKEPWEYFFHHSRKLLLNTQLSEKKLEEFWKLCDVKNYI